MIVTLYKNCILTNAYSEVMDVFMKDEDNKTAFDRYLESLTKITVEVDEVYSTNSGRLSFELYGPYGNIYECNYMKVYDDYNDFTRFAFIDSITVINGIASISYIEDVWSNYAKDMHLRNSLLTRSRIIDYGEVDFIIKPNGDRGHMYIPFYTLPAEYTGNNVLTIKREYDNSIVDENNDGGQCNLVLELQLYRLNDKGETSERRTGVFIARMGGTFSSVEGAESTEGNFNQYVQNAEDYLRRLIVQSSSQEIYKGTGDDKYSQYFYEISKAYLIPLEFGVTRLVRDLNEPFIWEGGVLRSMELFEVYNPWCGKLILQASYTITNNFKRLAVGTITQPIQLIKNSKGLEVNIYTIHDDNNFKVLMSVQNQMIEITESYLYEFPISVQTADVTQQQKTARAIENVNGVLQVIGGITNLVAGATTLGTSTALLGVGQASGQLGTLRAGQNATLGSAGDIVGGVKGIVGGITNLVVANKDMFVTNRGINARSSATLNARYGIVSLYIDPQNEREVRNIINETGYKCNEIVNQEIFKSAHTGFENEYNVLLFEYVKVYGSFTQSIATALGDILLNGIKIWYDELAIGSEAIEVWEGLYEQL